MEQTNSRLKSIFQHGRLVQQIAKATFALGLLVTAPSMLTARSFSTVSAPQSVGVSISGPSSFCPGSSATLTANVTGCSGSTSFVWKRNGVFMPGATTASIVVTNPGDYSVAATCSGSTGTSAVFTLSRLTLKTNVQNACPGSTGNVNLIVLNSTVPVTYSWSNGATTQDLMGVPSGLYSVVATDGNGCVATTSALVQNTIVNVNAGPDKTVCAGGSVQLQATGADNYKWTPAASLDKDYVSNPMATPGSTTTYTVTGYVNSGDLVNNGSFNQRNVGFTSDYAYVNGFAVGGYSSGTGLYPEGKYAVVPNRTDTNVTKMHPSFSGVGHNKGLAAGENDDFYMAVNGSSTQGQIVWSQSVDVLPNTVYNFTTWIASINLGNLSKLRFQINGVVLGQQITAPNSLNTWNQFFATWNSGNTTNATISIINDNLVLSGNDFGLDDISFSVSCMATDEVTVTYLPSLVGNAITCPAVTTFCLSGDAAEIVGSIPTGGNGTYTYQWEVSDDNSSFSPIDGATSANYNPSAVSATTHFRRKAMSGDCSIISNVCTVTIQGSISGNSLTAPSPTSFCASGNPGNIVGTELNNAGTATTTYMWESTTDGNEWFTIQGATAASYDPASINTTTSYRRVAQRGTCNSGASNVITFTVNPLPVITIPAAVQRCGPGTVSLEANATGTIKWYAASQGGVALATGSVYTATDLQQTTSFYAEASNLGCTSARVEVPATINARPTITSATPGLSCSGGNATVAAVASAGVVNWFADAAGSIALGSGNSISVPVAAATTVYALANNGGCTSADFTPVAITVGQNRTESLSATACNSYTWALNGVTYTASGTYSKVTTNSEGCTLTTTLNLTINTSSAVTLNVSINQGEVYAFNGQNLTIGGTYTMNSTGVNGCPMVTTLILTVVPTSNPNPNCGTNKIANGDFEAGNTGFMTSYTFTADLAGNTELVPENKYSVGANANTYHPQFIGTGRSGNFLIVNGNTVTEKELWAQDVTITSGREYTFKMYTQNLYTLNAPKFSFKITPNDGVSGSVEFGTSNPLAGRNGWIEVSATYTANFTGSAKLSIIDTDLTKIGNDFGIDDISFIETCPVTCSPVEVISFSQGTQSDNLTPVSADRSNTSEALGTPEDSDVATSAANNNFVSLGFAGEIVLKFAYPIKNGAGDDIYVVETTFGSSGNQNCARYPEKIRAFASQDNCNWVYLGEGCQNTYFDLQGLNWAQYVKLVDITNPLSFQGLVDGYDLDGVVCLHGEELNPVPTALVGGSAQTVVNYAPGTCKNGSSVPTARRNPANALGVAQNNNTVNFVALGFGGSLVVKFDYVIFNNPASTDIKVVETSFGNPSCANYPERAIVEGSLFENGPWTLLGELCQDGEVEIGAAGAIQYVRVTDRSAASSFGGSADAFDVDAIVVINPTCGTLAARAAAEQIVDVIDVANEEVSSNLFPNPASDMTVLSIEGTNANETWTVSIADISGRVISTRTFVSNEGISEHIISVSDLSYGIYQIVATNGSNKIVQKLVH